ncbi:aspartate carbamoyltransferase catalytic subunit [Mameliella sp. AT18]|uniref:aspartate carbamoyltransferase catalytic subunit n=1 Tax=Mameliella sp. AT18 TaxID=3028385 RepID=UPI0008411DF5|nr:aspartate carbamoyltransferase catalytic subunit [Mameliella sp. AT18]MDD9732578.1 aspartate carbamoyltransferase catalytic subunit [Mameliella sp. AT18]ODM48402.1 aspartate carbamoyltransferase catalytic subunit [Ruegeria sp. PBVC088]
MTRVQVNGSDRTTLYLTHLDLPPEAVERFTQMAGTGEWPLKYALGATRLRESFVDVVSIRDLGEMTLSQYLSAAYDVPACALEKDRARIDRLKGHAVVLPPQAFDGTSQELTIAPPLTLVGSYGEARPTAGGANPVSRAARGQGGAQPAARRSSGNSPLLKLILAAVALILALVLWLALV